MPKAKWGSGDQPLSAADIDGAEQIETRTRYSGEVPPGGTYRWTIQSLKQDVSKSSGNDLVVVFMTLDGTWKPNHKQWDGAPVWHRLALTQANAGFVRNFLDAIGGTSKDLMDGSIVDENGYITKLGRVGDPAGLQVYGTVQRRKPTKEYPDTAIEMAYGGYLMVTDDEDGADAAGPSGDVDTDPPF
jgi:hypothetical protein